MSTAVSPGQLTERLAIQQRTITRAANGEEVETWATLVTVWAEARPLRGREFFAANQTAQAVDVRFFIRHRPGITGDMRLVWNAQHYDIAAVIPGTGPYLGMIEIMAVSGVRNGR